MSDLNNGAGEARALRAGSGGGVRASRWDMAVIGAGPAGSVCAYSALAAFSLKQSSFYQDRYVKLHAH